MSKIIVRSGINLFSNRKPRSTSIYYSLFGSISYLGALFGGAFLIIALTSVSFTGSS
jgi:hypothetical protein